MESDRILLRPWLDSDAETLYKYASDPDVGPRAGWPPHQSVEESREVIRNVFNKDTTTWAIVLKETDEVIGAMGYGASCDCKLPTRDGEPIVGYWVAKPFWNRGYCTEALQLMLAHIRKTTDIQSLLCGHFTDNPASGRVMEKCGFVPTGQECYDESLYTGQGRPIRVLRLELTTSITRFIFNTVGLFTRDNKATVDFYTKTFGFTTDWDGIQPNVEMTLGGMRIILFPREAFEQMVSQKFNYPDGFNGTVELAFDVPTFADVDKEYQNALDHGAVSALPPTTEPWGQRTCYVADPDGNLIEIGSFVV